MSQERVSALEQQLRRLSQQSAFACLNGRDIAYTLAADMVHERDAQLFELAQKLEVNAYRETTLPEGMFETDHSRGYRMASADIAGLIRAILEGHTE